MAASNTDARGTQVDLTPLLDLVLQMVMFFMVCANFASQQLSMNVLLAQSRYAQEVQPGDEKDALIINVEVVRDKGKIRQPKQIVIDIFGYEPIRFWEAPYTPKPGDKIVGERQGLYNAQRRIHDIARDMKTFIAQRDDKPLKDVKIPVTVVLRGDREIHTGILHNLMGQCKSAGFPRVEVGTLQQGTSLNR